MHVLSFSPRHVEKKNEKNKATYKNGHIIVRLIRAFWREQRTNKKQPLSNIVQCVWYKRQHNYKCLKKCDNAVTLASVMRAYTHARPRRTWINLDLHYILLLFVKLWLSLSALFCVSWIHFFHHLLRFYLQICVSRIDLLPQYPVTADTFQIVLYRNHYAPLYLY